MIKGVPDPPFLVEQVNCIEDDANGKASLHLTDPLLDHVRRVAVAVMKKRAGTSRSTLDWNLKVVRDLEFTPLRSSRGGTHN